jgi:hypothetical protein
MLAEGCIGNDHGLYGKQQLQQMVALRVCSSGDCLAPLCSAHLPRSGSTQPKGQAEEHIAEGHAKCKHQWLWC